jgi:LAS superfamily LD-carboxypeptidase LdcB
MNNLQNLLIDAWNAGIYLKVNSAYRTYNDQARVAANPSSLGAAAPGRSNHGFGAAVDLANKDGTRINITGLSGGRPVPKTIKEWNWLQTNKHKYHFQNIDDKNESHHYNYVG